MIYKINCESLNIADFATLLMSQVRYQDHTYIDVINILTAEKPYGYETFFPNAILTNRIDKASLPHIFFKVHRYAGFFYTKIACIPKNVEKDSMLADFEKMCGFYVLPKEIRDSYTLNTELINAEFSLDILLNRAIIAKAGKISLSHIFKK